MPIKSWISDKRSGDGVGHGVLWGFIGVYGGLWGFYGGLWRFMGGLWGVMGVLRGFPRGTLDKWGVG